MHMAESVVATYSLRIELITALVKGEALSVVYVLIFAPFLKAVRHMQNERGCVAKKEKF